MKIPAISNSIHFGEIDSGSAWGSEHRKIYPNQILTKQKLEALERRQYKKPSFITKLLTKIVNKLKK